jgi:hypothetical protein
MKASLQMLVSLLLKQTRPSELTNAPAARAPRSGPVPCGGFVMACDCNHPWTNLQVATVVSATRARIAPGHHIVVLFRSHSSSKLLQPSASP